MIPEDDVNDPDSAQCLTARKLRKLLNSYEEKINISIPNYDDIHGKALLLAMGIKIGDKVAYGEEKVTPKTCSSGSQSSFIGLNLQLSVLFVLFVLDMCT